MPDLSRSSVVDGTGRAVIEIRPDGQQTWVVQQVSPEMPTAPAVATGTVRKNNNLVSPFEPRGDSVAGEPAVSLRLGDVLTVEWANCTPGDSARAYIIYEDGMGTR